MLLHVLTLSCSHEALVHFSCHYPQRNHCAFCLQNVSRLRLLPAPAVIQATVISHLDYGSNFLKGIPACAARLRFPPLVISSWALIPQKGPRLPSLCASADLSSECQIPLSHFLLSDPLGPPQPLLVFPIQFPERRPSSAQAENLSVVDSSFLPPISTPNPAHSPFKLYPQSDRISPPHCYPSGQATTVSQLDQGSSLLTGVQLPPGAHMVSEESY